METVFTIAEGCSVLLLHSKDTLILLIRASVQFHLAMVFFCDVFSRKLPCFDHPFPGTTVPWAQGKMKEEQPPAQRQGEVVWVMCDLGHPRVFPQWRETSDSPKPSYPNPVTSSHSSSSLKVLQCLIPRPLTSSCDSFLSGKLWQSSDPLSSYPPGRSSSVMFQRFCLATLSTRLRECGWPRRANLPSPRETPWKIDPIKKNYICWTIQWSGGSNPFSHSLIDF